jgi:hypothetical protein
MLPRRLSQRSHQDVPNSSTLSRERNVENNATQNKPYLSRFSETEMSTSHSPSRSERMSGALFPMIFWNQFDLREFIRNNGIIIIIVVTRISLSR